MPSTLQASVKAIETLFGSYGRVAAAAGLVLDDFPGKAGVLESQVVALPVSRALRVAHEPGARRGIVVVSQGGAI
jgi:hypothetical protein